MSNICFYISLPQYLAQWFINDQGGEYPVKLRRGSIEAKIVETFVQTPPKNESPVFSTDDDTAVLIPHFRRKDPVFYNYLSPIAKDAICETIRNRFDIELFNDLFSLPLIHNRIDMMLEAWMQCHGIEINDTNWNAVAKRYQRQRKAYRATMRKRKERAKKSEK